MPVDEFELLHIGSKVINMSMSLAWAKLFHSRLKCFFQTDSLMCGTCLTACTIFFFLWVYVLILPLCTSLSLSERSIFCKSPPSGNQPKKFNGGIMSVLDVSTISHLPEGTLLKDFTVIWFTRVPAGAKAKAKTNSLAERRDFCKDAIKLSCCF